MRCAVVGAGAWGTALADLLARNGNDVVLWAREPDVAESVNERHENARFLAGHPLSPALRATTQLADAVRDAGFITYAAPSHVLRLVARDSAPSVDRGATLAVARASRS
jgi:glycerol-3-phosphate dehydrogenase (NAD(P)+)